MVFDLHQITGLGSYTQKAESSSDASRVSNSSYPHSARTLYFKDNKAFLIVNPNTIEVRCDPKLSENLKDKYESVMESRYFGRGGIEIVLAGQLDQQELADLIRLSYNLTN